MKVEFFINKENQTSAKVADKFKSILVEEGFEICETIKDNSVPDFIACFGGDGTVLALSKYACECGAPVLSVNTGTIGFLAGVEPNDLKKAIADLKTGNYTISERSLLKVFTKNAIYCALNDAVVERDKCSDKNSVISKLNVKIGGNTVYDLRSDGVIVSTPTGSTAYSLSAGGVILTPELNSFILTPICSHSLTTRPIVYSDDKEVEITVIANSSDCALCVDGRCVEKLGSNASVTISKSEKRLKIIEFEDNFFKKIKTKLGE